MVEGARAETGRDAASEDPCGYACATVRARQDECDAEAERGVKAELVEYASQLRLYTIGGRDHRLSLGPDGTRTHDLLHGQRVVGSGQERRKPHG